MNSYQSIKKITIFEIVQVFVIPHTSSTVQKVFLVLIICNDIITLFSIEIASFLCVIFFYKYGSNLSRELECIMRYTRSLFKQFSMKKPDNNLLVNPKFLSDAHTLQSLIFILSLKQMLKIMAFSHSPMSANACISSTCCTIMYIHQY